jgi:hypothetical protein
MGTLRWEKEDEERAKTIQRHAEFERKRSALELAEADTRARINALEHELERQRVELTMYSRGNKAQIASATDRDKELRRIRSADGAGAASNEHDVAVAKRHRGNGSENSLKRNKAESRDGP